MKCFKNMSCRIILIAVIALGLTLSGCKKEDSTSVNELSDEVKEPSDKVREPSDEAKEPSVNIYDPSDDTSEPGASSGISEETDKNKVVVRMVGDILLHDGVNRASRTEDGGYNYDRIFENTKELIQEADIAIVNQEVIIGGKELNVTGYPSFNAPCEIGDSLEEAGFDVVLHATNHALDRGEKGITNCINYWEENHPDMVVLGINEDEQAKEAIEIVTVNDIKIALLNYTYGTNGIAPPSDKPYIVDTLNEERLYRDINKADSMADFVIVMPHWGTEYRLTKDSSQEKWAGIMLDAGADLVIGTHPHVIEPVEMITDGNDKEMLVYYSLGNFVNFTSGSGKGVANRVVGGMADVTLVRDDSGRVSIDDYGIIALVTDLHSEVNGITTYRLSEYTEDMAIKNEIVSKDPDFSKEYCTNLCNQVWKDLWK